VLLLIGIKVLAWLVPVLIDRWKTLLIPVAMLLSSSAFGSWSIQAGSLPVDAYSLGIVATANYVTMRNSEGYPLAAPFSFSSIQSLAEPCSITLTVKNSAGAVLATRSITMPIDRDGKAFVLNFGYGSTNNAGALDQVGEVGVVVNPFSLVDPVGTTPVVSVIPTPYDESVAYGMWTLVGLFFVSIIVRGVSPL